VTGAPGRRQRWRAAGVAVAVWAATAALLGRAFHLQVWEGARWRARALAQQERRIPLPAPRGSILDRSGRPVAVHRETYRVSVAPQELRDREAAARAFREVLGFLPSTAARAVDPRRRWVVLPGRVTAVERERLQSRIGRGVYFEPSLDRFHPLGELGLGLVGAVSADGAGLDGVELAFDSLLAGRPGVGVRRLDGTGAARSLTVPVVAPTRGHDLVLTLDAQLQGIAEATLDDAIEATAAEGGDLLIVEPATGDLLALVSRRPGRPRSLAAVTEPYEPGSTLKPFVAAALLAEGKAGLDDVVEVEGGRIRVAGRVIRDDHPPESDRLTLREVLRWSSNVGMVKLAQRLEPQVQYAYLRDFGFGTPTGVALPAESPGLLRRPSDWSAWSQASLAMGYEIAVTPLQLAMAYAAIANDGVLMRPRIVREVRDAAGRVVAAPPPEPVRRVVPASVAGALRAALVEAVSEGTGRAARVAHIAIAGKTGTAQRFDSEAGYTRERYTASFVGLVPAERPQWVILVKLDDPKRTYYGGAAAAPAMRWAVRAALAGAGGPVPPPLGEPVRPDAMAGVAAGRAPAPGLYVFALDRPLVRVAGSRGESSVPIRVPDVRGLDLRVAARRLHDLGFRVRIVGSGRVIQTEPGVGAEVPPGSVLVVRAARPNG
jgi:cell division protein FtsI (penicillin-binding protein 3)